MEEIDLNKKEIQEKLSEGYIHFNTIIELVGKPRDHVDKTIKDYVAKLEENEHYIITKKDISKAKKTDDGYFSSFAELEILVKEVQGVIAFCFNYMPASIEIIEPSEIVFNNVKLTDIMNELQAKLHEVDMIAKGANQKVMHLSENFNGLLANFIKYSCIKEKDIPTLSKITGFDEKVLEPFLENLVKNGKLNKADNKYKLKVE